MAAYGDSTPITLYLLVPIVISGIALVKARETRGPDCATLDAMLGTRPWLRRPTRPDRSGHVTRSTKEKT